LHGQFYSQQDIRDLIQYAAFRGIRIVPEFDVPGHSSGFDPLATRGMQFCNSARMQLYDDPENRTYSILTTLFAEMAQLFTDKVFHIGCDETSVAGPCTLENTRTFEQKLQRFLVSVGKQPMGWDEIFSSTKSILNNTISEDWAHSSPQDSIRAGYPSVDAYDPLFYLDHSECQIPNKNTNCLWVDIAPNFTPAELKLLFGGESPMWCDDYIGSLNWMSQTKYDAMFIESFSSCVWPRATAAGGSFWNYRSDLKTTDAEFLRRYNAHHQRLTDRGIISCPAGCVCSQGARCGVPYHQ